MQILVNSSVLAIVNCAALKAEVHVVGVHKGLTAYSFNMAHCGDLTNKGWSHSGHIALEGILFFLKAISCFSLLVPISLDYVTVKPFQLDPTRPQLQAKDKLRPPPTGAQFPIFRV